MYQKRKIRKEKRENSNQNEKFHKVVLNWVPCQPGIISPPQTFEALEKRKREIEKNQNGMTWYLSFQNVKDCEKIGQTSCEGNKLE